MTDQADEVGVAVSHDGLPLRGPSGAQDVVGVLEDHVRLGRGQPTASVTTRLSSAALRSTVSTESK